MFSSNLFKLNFRPLKKVISSAFTRHLFLTNVTISLTMSGTGDIIQQHYRIKCLEQNSWDKSRTKNMTFTGITVGILCHHWYQVLDQKLPGSGIKVVLKKLVIDQIIFSPICISVFIVSLSLIRGIERFVNQVNENPSQLVFPNLKKELRSFKEDMTIKGMKLYLAEWVVWPPAQLINFYFLPTRFRVLYDNTISLLYDIYASHIVHHDVPKPDIGNPTLLSDQNDGEIT